MNAFEKSIDCALGLALSNGVLCYLIYRRIQKMFQSKIEPVFSVGTGDPERSSYDLQPFYRYCIF